MSEMPKKPVALLILDGWGHSDTLTNNGIALAKKPFFDSLWQNYPHTLLDGSGPAVGLPKGIMGNSEVGHMNLGAGRIVFSGLSQIYQAIETKTFFANAALLKAIQQAQTHDSTLHLMGLVSDGAVHSHEDHLFALLKLAAEHKVQDVAIHCFLDGRDTGPSEALHAIERLEKKMQEVGVGRIASVSGRYFAMDRDKNWQRVEPAFWAICGQGTMVSDAKQHVRDCYAKNITDEFVTPVCVQNADANTNTTVRADDAMIFFNFRADRARQISHAFVDQIFSGFDRHNQTLPGVFVGMAPYDSTLTCPAAFQPSYPKNTLPDVLVQNHLRQLRIAETEKYAHVTFFFSGGVETPLPGEDRILIPSAKDVATYDLKPEMSAYLIRDALVAKIKAREYDFILCNFANTDMVGHTAIPAAIQKAVETIDVCLHDVVSATLAADGVVLITADHGNAEYMADNEGRPVTAHTTNLVPCILVGQELQNKKLKKSGGRLCDVAPTLLEILKLKKPPEMTGVSLIEGENE